MLARRIVSRAEVQSSTKVPRFDTGGEGAIEADRALACATVHEAGRFGTNGGARETELDGDGRFELVDVVEPALALLVEALTGGMTGGMVDALPDSAFRQRGT